MLFAPSLTPGPCTPAVLEAKLDELRSKNVSVKQYDNIFFKRVPLNKLNSKIM